jgi:hypothetical protein
MSSPANDRPERSKGDGITIAIIGAIATILAAIIAAVITHNSGPSNSGPSNIAASSPSITSVESAQAGSPSATQPSVAQSSQPQGSPSFAASPTISPLSTRVPILAPTDDPGFSPVWHGTFIVTAAGVSISSSGVYPGTAQDWDLAYQAGGDGSGWQANEYNSDNGSLFEFQGTGTPDPAWCKRESGLGGEATFPSPPQVGQRDCYTDINGVVGYFQVTNVGPNGPTVIAWFWRGPTST